MADQCETIKTAPRDVPVSSGLAIAVLSVLAAMGKPDRILSVYDKGRSAAISTWRNGIAAGDPVEAVVDKVVQAATEKGPSIRYTPGKNGRPSSPHAALHPRKFIPEKTFDKSFRKQMNVPD
jgi:hypothetical protein